MTDQCGGFASPCDEGVAFDTARGEGGAPSLSPASADGAADATAGLSDPGAPGGGDRTRDRHPHLGTPSDLARRSAGALGVAPGELSPWRSVLPPRCVEGRAFDTGGGNPIAAG